MILRIFTISDIHVDFDVNWQWVNHLSCYDYKEDILILAGDVTHTIPLFIKTLKCLKERFLEVLYVPGNHDLWVRRNDGIHSLEKLQLIMQIANDNDIRMEPFYHPLLAIIPLFGWYDYSFSQPSPEILLTWADYIACLWPEGYDENRITQHFIKMNESFLTNEKDSQFIISFSHFLPRIDIMPAYIPLKKRTLYSVLGTTMLEKQIRKLGSNIHVYGHSHVNNQVVRDNVIYVNNAFGYPYETRITAKQLKCIFEIG